jgi:aminocarboxymuconate-semialdehyde decarboxylase
MLIDGLQCGHFTREIFTELRQADVGAVTVTCGFWEGAVESLDAIARWRDLVAANHDLVAIARTAAEIEVIAEQGRTAIILGFQNSNLLDGRIRFVELFAELGVRCIQLTYNNQNELGGSCYEEEDSGLARFGKEVVREMNRAGVMVDLSHVGNRTTRDAILWSEKPVAVTHANPDSLFQHKRNKTDDVLRALAERGGVLGCATYRNITGDHYSSSLRAWCEMVARTVDLIGIDHVAIGTDRSHNFTKPDYDWMRMGRWTRGIDYGAGSAARPGKAPPPSWFTEVRHLGLLPGGLAEVGFSPPEVEKIARQLAAAVQGGIRSMSTPLSEERIALDVHAHLAPVLPDRLDAIAGVDWSEDAGALTIDGYTLAAKSVYRPEALVAWMDGHRVERAWISIPPPLYRLGLDAEATRAWARYANDGLDAMAARFPHRLTPMHHLPVTHPELAADIAAERAAAGAARFAMPAGSQDHGSILSDPAYGRLWSVLDAARAFLFLHPVKGCDPRYVPFYLHNLLGSPVETALAAAHLAMSGVLERHPGMTVCLAHGGGATAAVAGRLERGQVTGRPGADTGAERPRVAFKRLCVDCITHDPDALRLAAEMHGEGHVLFGSDWPFSMGLPDPHAQLADVAAPLRRRIFCDNPKALKLLPE